MNTFFREVRCDWLFSLCFVSGVCQRCQSMARTSTAGEYLVKNVLPPKFLNELVKQYKSSL
ncbi:hypothetical protein QWZ16_05125 [Vibrio ostreicida]|uniref:Uncharacterized protein n=1 Tax=Vibrio ostreicida TaxID=526588 RepID=A0ABT8BQC9_9VIBR|nr:hypothetical protein [Vibrio ostreicida]MDN3609106.1 hypothetical protein [Vibrio ostreicida]